MSQIMIREKSTHSLTVTDLKLMIGNIKKLISLSYGSALSNLLKQKNLVNVYFGRCTGSEKFCLGLLLLLLLFLKIFCLCGL